MSGAGKSGSDGDTDTYIFAAGDGIDLIQAGASSAGVPRDVIRFGAGIVPQAVTMVDIGGAGVRQWAISYGDGDKIVLGVGAESTIDRLQFDDGTVKSLAELIAAQPPATGGNTAPPDGVIRGTDMSDVLHGTAGDDALVAGGGDDVLVGGAGDDALTGGQGNNVYWFAPGSGADMVLPSEGETGVLAFEGLTLADLVPVRQGSDLLLQAGVGDTVRIHGFFDRIDVARDWSIQTGTTNLNLGEWVNGHLQQGAQTLADRRDEFIAQQRGELASLPLVWNEAAQRLDRLSGVGQQTIQLQSGQSTALGASADPTTVTTTTSRLVNRPVYGDVPVMTQSITYNTISWPAGAVRIALPEGAITSMSEEDGLQVLIPNVTGNTNVQSEQRIVGWQSTVETQSGASFVVGGATQYMVHGTDGANTISVVPSTTELGSFFRGQIEAGGGDDVIVLSAAGDEREFDWFPGNANGSADPALLLYNHDRGLGAWIDAGDGDDVVVGTDGADVIIGGGGSDTLNGGTGADTYLVGVSGNAVDTIADLASAMGIKPNLSTVWLPGSDVPHAVEGWTSLPGWEQPHRDRVEFDDTVALDKLTYRWVDPGADGFSMLELMSEGRVFLRIAYSQSTVQGLTTKQPFNLGSPIPADMQTRIDSLEGVEVFVFADGTTLSIHDLLARVPAGTANAAPQVSGELAPQSVMDGQRWTFAVPESAFTDSDPGDTLQWSAALAGGQPLPAWLTFDSATRTFSGSPPEGQLGSLMLALTVVDRAGASAMRSLELNVVAATPLLVQGTEGDDVLLGAAANDLIIAGGGNDVLTGGRGDDELRGGLGNNTYVFGRGDGQDRVTVTSDATPGKLNTLQFKAGVTPADVVLKQVADTELSGNVALEFAIAGTADKIVFNGFFSDSNPDGPNNGLQQVKFADGTTWDLASIKAALFAGTAGADAIKGTIGNDSIKGAAGDDTLAGEAGDDLLDGNEGADILNGGTGNSTYVFGRGDGQDRVTVTNDATPGKLNTLQFKAGVAPADVVLKQVADTELSGNAALEFAIAGTADKIVFNGFFSDNNPDGPNNGLQQVKFADGTTWDLASIKAALFAGTAGADAIKGTIGNDSIKGAAGDDTLAGDAGDDLIDGNEGADVLNGGTGSNTYLFGRGDGQDRVTVTSDATPGKLNTLQFKAGVAPADVVLKQVLDTEISGNAALEFAIAGTADKIVFNGFLSDNNPGGPNNGLQQVKFADGTTWNLAAIVSKLQSAPNVVLGTPGNDILSGTSGFDSLDGGAGDDVLRGLAGDDTLIGGRGIDYLVGGSGSNVYVFGRGDGQDIIEGVNDASATKLNTIQFKAGVLPTDVAAKRVYDSGYESLELRIVGTTDKITVRSFFIGDDPANPNNPVQQVKFADGTTWDMAAILAQAFRGTTAADTINGTVAADTIGGLAGSDSLAGRSGNDWLLGGDGNDTLDGEAGNDTLDGGRGSDYLVGGSGNNAYVLGRGDGQDIIEGGNDASATKLNTIQFRAGVLPSDVTAKRVYDSGNESLELSIVGTTDKITARSFFIGDDPGNSNNPVQQVKFADGTTWDIAAIQAQAFRGSPAADTINGTIGADTIGGLAGSDSLAGRSGDDLLLGGDGNDSLNGEARNDTLDGGRGTDYLVGGSGNNAYVFGRGDGQDIIEGVNDNSETGLGTIQFRAGVQPSDVAAKRVYDSGNESLELSIVGTTDKITARYFFNGDDPGNSKNPVQQVKFADGTTWDIATIKAQAFRGSPVADTINGTTADDTISGQAGNDSLSGRSGNDLLLGGDGNDSLYGEAGNDTLDGGRGTDYLVGGSGNDAYIAGRGIGADTAYDADSMSGNTDVLQFSSDVASNQLWFRRVGSNLEVSIIGTADKVTISSWYASTANHVEQFKSGDGKTLLDSQVDALVSAMAGFAPPAAGQTSLPANYQSQLNPILVANWH